MTFNHDQTLDHLAGQMLVATPAMVDHQFRRTVVFVCAHSPNGTLGLVINRAATGVTGHDLIEANDVRPVPKRIGIPIHIGGPACPTHVATLHDRGALVSDRTTPITREISVTPGIAFMRDVVATRFGMRSFVALGHCAWGPGQLEAEIARCLWLTRPATSGDVFVTPVDRRWHEGMNHLNVAPERLSAVAGHA